MLAKLTISTALTAALLASSPSWAISTVTMPANNNTAQYTDPANRQQKPITGTADAFGSYSTGSFGTGGSFSLSIGTPQSQYYAGQPVPGTPFGNPAFQPSFQNPNRGFSNFPTDGAAQDPTFGPSGAYAPQFNNKR